MFSGKQKIEDLSLIEKGAAGSCASLFSGSLAYDVPLSQSNLSDLLVGMVLCPTELVKCRLQAAKQMGQADAGVISTVRWHQYLVSSTQNMFTEIFL